MKKTKLSRIAALLAAGALLFGGMFMSCSDGGDDGDVGKSGTGKSDPGQSTDSKITMNGTAYSTIQAALDAATGTGRYTIKLAKGTYAEDGLSYNGAATIKISGDTTTEYGTDVIILGKGSSQNANKTRCTLEFQGTGNLILENLTIQNTFSRIGETTSNTQCEVFGFDSTGTVAAYNCSFKSHQDTMRTTGKCWVYGCYIEGDVDFIWMEVSGIVALYENCNIVMVGDETNAGYVMAPRASISSLAGKGVVLYNSTITIPTTGTKVEKGVVTETDTAYDAYLFRSPWTPAEFYNQAAVIDTTISGTFNSKLANSQAGGTSDQQYVGWKVDSAIADAYTSKDSTIGTVSDSVKSVEYNGRRAILNRMYSVASAKFQKDVETFWDVDKVISDNGWTVTDDSSSALLDGETEATIVIYDYTSADGNGYTDTTCTGFAHETGKAHAKSVAGNTISFAVTDKAVVSVYGYYAGWGTISMEGQTGNAVYNFNNGSTSSVVEKSFVNYTGAGKVTITATSASYITKIKVSYDSTLAYVPVTAIDVSSDKDDATVGVSFTASATVTPDSATLQDVTWSSSSESIAKVNSLTGEVSPAAEGTVTITATANDGSGVKGTKTYEVSKAVWTQAEWYTTDSALKTDADDEAGCLNGSAFSFGSSTTCKSLGSQVSFTNINGDTISTSNGLKLNSSGKLYISTTSSGILTLVVKNDTNTAGKPGVAGAKEDTVVTDAESSTSANLTTYKYYLSGADTYTIDRGSATSEINPIVYAKIDRAPVPGNTYTYDFSNVYHIAQGISNDSFVSWSGSAGNDHGIQNATITVKVFKNTKVTLGLCQYNNTGVTVTDSEGNTVATVAAKTASECFSKSKSELVATDANSYTFVYSGESDTEILTISGSQYFEGIVLAPFTSNVAVTGITVSAADDATSVTEGTTLQLTATVTPDDATDSSVTWSSSDEAIAKVSSKGVVTGVSTGNATITATANDGSKVKGTYSVEVTANVAPKYGTVYEYDFVNDTTKTGTIADNVYTSTDGYVTATVEKFNHGLQTAGNAPTMAVQVAGAAKLTITGCTYDSKGLTYKVTDADGNVVQAETATGTRDVTEGSVTYTATYTGTSATTLTVTYNNQAYIHALKVEPAE